MANYRVIAEYLGSLMLLLVVAGSGVMGESLSGGNVAVALLANSIATGCGLYVLITILGPISGAHFNPAVTLIAWRSKVLTGQEAWRYVLAQIAGAVSGVWLTHILFALPILQVSTKSRHGLSLWVSEFVATLVLLSVIHLGAKYAKDKLPMLIALIVTGGYWFTSSTFFANPAVTIARSLTNTFVGIAPVDIVGFVTAQLAATLLMIIVIRKI